MPTTGIAPARSGSVANPYVGPRPYTRDEQALFFGREQEAADLLSLIAAHSLVILHSATGAGKSSLLNTQVYSRTAEELALPEFAIDALPITTVRSAIPEGFTAADLDRVNIYVFNAKAGWARGIAPPARNQMLGDSLAAFLRRCKASAHPHPDRPWIAVFDQFEEIFTAYPHRWKERGEFLDQLAEASADPALADLRIVLSMREEYLGQLESYENRLPLQGQIRYHLERLDREAALEAIVKPAVAGGRTFEKAAANELVSGLLQTSTAMEGGGVIHSEGQYAEPVLLQVVCNNIWENLRPETTNIGAAEVARFGDLNRVLIRFYEKAIAAAVATVTDRSIEQDLRQWCERQLITPVSTRSLVMAGDTGAAGIPMAAIRALEEHRLIRAEERAGARWYELTHDTLIPPIRESNRNARFWAGIPGVFDGESLEQWLEFQRQILRKYRKLHHFAGRTLDQLIDAIPDKPEDPEMDRRNARLLFATYVLDGTIHLSRQVPERGYDVLERIWLNDVKQFVAYLIWENKKVLWDSPGQNYEQACGHLRTLISRKEAKPASSTRTRAFDKIRTYLESRYGTPAGRSDLIRTKAYWYSLLDPKPEGRSDWELAETFVSRFYGHIIPAVTECSDEDTLMVLKAIQQGEPHQGSRVMNAFEAAIAIHYLDAEVVARLCTADSAQPIPETVALQAKWPATFRIPEAHRQAIAFDKASGTLVCRCPMTLEQRDAILHQLMNRETCDGVTRIFEESRRVSQSRIF